MRRCNAILAGALAVILLADASCAQPPDGPRAPGGDREGSGTQQSQPAPRGPEGRGPGEGRARTPLILALDTDGDGEVSAAEIANATAALRTLDRDGDGRLSREELRPEQEKTERTEKN